MVMKIILWIIGGFFAFLVIGNLLHNSNADNPKWRSRDAISLCWEGQAKKSNSDGDSQFIAGACERMEREFVKTYGVNP